MWGATHEIAATFIEKIVVVKSELINGVKPRRSRLFTTI
jgi:hypothetical protein